MTRKTKTCATFCANAVAYAISRVLGAALIAARLLARTVGDVLRPKVTQFRARSSALLLSALIAAFGSPAAAFDGPTSTSNLLLPGTGDGLSQCLITVHATDASGPFALGGEAYVTVFLGLTELGKIGHYLDVGGTEQKFTYPGRESSFPSNCNVSVYKMEHFIDTSATLAGASLVSFMVEYLGQDGKAYRASASLQGATGTVASASVIEIPIPTDPEIALRGNYNKSGNTYIMSFPNGLNLDVGELDLTTGESVTFNFTAENTGYAQATLTDLNGVASDNINGSVNFVGAPASGPVTIDVDASVQLGQAYLAPTSVGPFSYAISVATNDPERNPYTITIVGTVVDTPKPELGMVTPAPSPTAIGDARPFVFTSTEAGSISLTSFGCSIPTGRRAFVGENTVNIQATILGGSVTTINSCSIAVTDAAGNVSDPLAVPAFVIDDEDPSVSFGAMSDPITGPVPLDITFSEAVTGFQASDVLVSGGRVSSLSGSGRTYQATITPSVDGQITISVPRSVVTDAVGNPNTASNEVSVVYDGTAPTVMIADFTGPLNGEQTAIITLSEDSADFTVDDLTLTNAAATLSGSGASYTAVLTPLTDGPVTLSVAAGTFSDAAGNLNTASNEVSIVYDSIAPTVSIADFTGPLNGEQTAIITLSEDSADFTVDDLTLTNATATLSGSGASYTAVLTPLADGLIALSVGVGTFSDAAGNFNAVASNEVSVVFDGTAPTVAISTATTSVSGATIFDVAVVFSESVTDFEVGDVAVANGSATAVSGSGTDYTATIAATGSGDVEVFIPEAVATDAAGNPNRASNVLSVSNATGEDTQKVIAQFMQTRANLLISSQPGLTGFVSDRGALSSFTASATRGRGSFSFMNEPSAGNNLWLRLNGTWANEAERDSEYLFGAVGTHVTVSPDFLLGTMAEFDYLNQENGRARVEGRGWMVGPYFVAKQREEPLYVEGRLLYGRTLNDVSPFGTYTDNFETERVLAMFKIAGEVEQGATTWMPSVQISYTADDQEAYTDSLGNVIPEQGIALGQVELGLDLSHVVPLSVSHAALELTGGIAAIGSSTGGSGYAGQVVPEYEGGRARIRLGANYAAEGRGTFSIDAFYDGIGVGGFEDFGLQARVALTF